MILSLLDDDEIENNKVFLRRMRNDIVGSIENKTEYIKNNYFIKVLNTFADIKEQNDIEYLKLLLGVVNSFVLSNKIVNYTKYCFSPPK
jgi:hypothetical protein